MDQHLSRRAVIAGAGIVGAAAAVTSVSTTSADAATVPLKASTFTPHVGKQFRIDIGRQHHHVTLDSVNAVSGSKDIHEDAFSLRFLGPKADREGGETARLHLPTGETLTLFVVPGRPDRHGQEWNVTVMNVVSHV